MLQLGTLLGFTAEEHARRVAEAERLRKSEALADELIREEEAATRAAAEKAERQAAAMLRCRPGHRAPPRTAGALAGGTIDDGSDSPLLFSNCSQTGSQLFAS